MENSNTQYLVFYVGDLQERHLFFSLPVLTMLGRTSDGYGLKKVQAWHLYQESLAFQAVIFTNDIRTSLYQYSQRWKKQVNAVEGPWLKPSAAILSRIPGSLSQY